MLVEIHRQGSGAPLGRDAIRDYARRAFQLDYPSLLPVVDVGMDEDGGWSLTLRGIEGGRCTLPDVARFAASIEAACSIALSLAEAFSYLHRVGFRGGMSLDWDEQVWAGVPDGESWFLAVVPPTPEHLHLPRRGFRGDPFFAAPEIIEARQGLPTPASDSFCLAALLFQLLTHEPLLSATTPEDAFREIQAGKFPAMARLIPDIPDRLAEIIRKALGRRPSVRPSLAEWGKVMTAFGGGVLPRAPGFRGLDDLFAIPGRELESLIPDPKVLRLVPEPVVRRFRVFPLRKEGRRLSVAMADTTDVQVLDNLKFITRMDIEPVKSSWPSISAAIDEFFGAEESPAFSILADSDFSGQRVDLPRVGLSHPGRIRFSRHSVPDPILPPEIGKNPCRARRPELDPVDLTVFGSPRVGPGEVAFLQVYLHLPEEDAVAEALAEEFDEDSRRLGFLGLQMDVPPKARIQVHLAFPGLDTDDPVRELAWRRRTESVQFGVEIPPETRPGKVMGEISAFVNGVPAGRIKFILRIQAADAASGDAEPRILGERSHRYQQAFLSYASQDRAEVLKRAQMLERCRVRYFQDLLSLEPGDRWERQIYREIDKSDLFLLFWSTAARESEWVEKEVRYALDRQREDGSDFPDIIPIMIEGPPVPEPPDYLTHLHFNDRLLYFMAE